jgi:bla regulator protein BlaR1
MTLDSGTLTALSPLANHLWQSTLCFAAVYLLTRFLRRNRAAVRYALWLAASLKFLFPFSLLVGMGSRFAWIESSVVQSTTMPPQWSYVVENIGQPFAFSAPTTHSVTAISAVTLPQILFAIWIAGFLVSFALCFRWWRQMHASRKLATPLPLDFPIPVLSSPTLLEPGVFGIRRPVLLLPEGITSRLTPAQLQAILAHEICHVRRRDNLTAALHMLVEAIFWFYPPVWWIRARLLEERERACDEAVVQSGADAESYAEGILNVCKLYVESPLVCVSGIGGADLNRRIGRIMAGSTSRKLSLAGKLSLAAVCVAAIGGPLGFGAVDASLRILAQLVHPNDPMPSFEVASIRPSGPDNHGPSHGTNIGIERDSFVATNITIEKLIELAYGASSEDQVKGAPGWLKADKYDVKAKIDESHTSENLPDDKRMEQVQWMLQSLLRDRLELKASLATNTREVYRLVVAKNGPKLTRSDVGATGPHDLMGAGKGRLKGSGVTIENLAAWLSGRAEVGGLPVSDATGLAGYYDFTLQWEPDQLSSPMFKGPDSQAATPIPDSSGPSIFTALQDQLGLKLEAQKGPVEVLVIDHIERPSEN